jgi:hypothetical protein
MPLFWFGGMIPMRQFIRIATCSCVVLLSGIAHAQELSRQTATQSIEIGQNIADTHKLLRALNIPVSVNGLAMAQGDPDEDYLSFTLDKRFCFAVVFYSKSTKKVTELSVVFHPEGEPQKAGRVWMPAKKIVIREDHSYAVEFPAPVAVQQKQ